MKAHLGTSQFYNGLSSLRTRPVQQCSVLMSRFLIQPLFNKIILIFFFFFKWGQLQQVKELIPRSLSKNGSHLANGQCENGPSVREQHWGPMEKATVDTRCTTSADKWAIVSIAINGSKWRNVERTLRNLGSSVTHHVPSANYWPLGAKTTTHEAAHYESLTVTVHLCAFLLGWSARRHCKMYDST